MTLTVACASNSDTILNANLAQSPMFAAGTHLHLERNAPTAAIAYNRALDATTSDIVVFAHHDVYLPHGWQTVLAARLAEVVAVDPDWALLGAFGVGLDAAHIGPVWSSSLGQIVGRVPMRPTQVQSFDELLIVMRRSSGLRFDETAPGWHMFGTDIVQTARSRGLRAYSGGLPTIHNDRYHDALQSDFVECYRFMQRKWRSDLPLRTPIIKISRSGLHLYRNRWRNRASADFRADMAVGVDHAPQRLAELCGWSDLTV